jgi:hypothetical protein
MLTSQEIYNLHKKNAGRICWIEDLAANDNRMALLNDKETLYIFMESDNDIECQAHVARLCQAINSQRELFK